MVTHRSRRRISSRICLGAAGAALTLVVLLLFGVVTTPSAQAQTYTVLYNFTGGTDGGTPYSGLLGDDRKRNLYGTAYQGGAYGYGVVFKLDKNDNFSVLHSFSGGDDGAYPYAGLTRGSRLWRKQRHGTFTFYGTTYSGGAYGYGVMFKVRPYGAYAVVHSFAGGTTDGCNPTGESAWTRAVVGTTYGCGAFGYGTLFNLSEKGTYTHLHSFAGGTKDGAHPYAGTSIDKNYWGTVFAWGVTEEGGAFGYGVLYNHASGYRNGAYNVVHNFAGGTTDGCNPAATPKAWYSRGSEIILGTAEGCGSSNDGVVWQITAGTYAVAHNFAGGTTDGAFPYGGLVGAPRGRAGRGTFYGTTAQGGTFGLGTVYALKDGTVTVLHSFAGSDGEYPYAGVTVGGNGDLYGTTSEGGTYGYGTVWKLTP